MTVQGSARHPPGAGSRRTYRMARVAVTEAGTHHSQRSARQHAIHAAAHGAWVGETYVQGPEEGGPERSGGTAFLARIRAKRASPGRSFKRRVNPASGHDSQDRSPVQGADYAESARAPHLATIIPLDAQPGRPDGFAVVRASTPHGSDRTEPQ